MSITYASERNVQSKSNPPSNQLTTYNTWTRPADWLTLPTVGPTDQKFAGLYAVFDSSSNYVALTASVSTGTYTVDWGDGSSPVTYSSGAQAQYNYDYATVSSGTLTTRGYKQCIITVTPTTGNLLTVALNAKYTQAAGYPTLPKYNSKWLDVIVGSPYLTSMIVTPNGAVVSAHMLEQFTLVSKSSSWVSFTDLFYYCYGLRKVNIDANTSNVTDINAMYYYCINLEEAPYFDTSNCTSMNYTFGGCYSLKSAPLYDTTKVTSTQYMFQNCYDIVEIPPYNTSNVTNMTYTFGNCFSLQTLPYFDTKKVTILQQTFFACKSLEEVPLYDTSNVTSFAQTFSGCSSLRSVPLFNMSNVNTVNGMFNTCSNLVEVPKFNTATLADSGSFFASCTSLQTIPQFDLANVTTTVSMFQGCTSLTSVPDLNLSKCTTANSMFATCNSLPTIGNLTTPNLTSAASMFSGCATLESVPLFDTSKVTSMTTMFSTCTNLKSEGLPEFNTSNVTTMNGMFQSCQSLVTIPTFNTSKATTFGAMFNGANSLAGISALNMSNATVAAASFASSTSSMGNCQATGMKFAIDFSNSLMGKTNLETMFTNLGTPASAQTLTITNNPGADTAVSKVSNWTTSSKNVTIASSGSVVAGMYMYSSVAIQAINCSFTDASDRVTVTGGPATAPIDGTLVAFPSIVSTTGITINTLYYVVNAGGSSFQVALTPGGAPIALTTNGTGTMRYALTVTSVVGTTVTLDNFPMAAGTGLTVTFRYLNTNLASFKLWTVTG